MIETHIKKNWKNMLLKNDKEKIMLIFKDLRFTFENADVVIKEPKAFAENFADAVKNFRIEENGDFDLKSFGNFIDDIFRIDYIDFVMTWSNAEQRTFKNLRPYTLKEMLNGRTLTKARAVDIIKYISDTMNEFANWGENND